MLLLELANRQIPRRDRSAEIPAWLVDGMAQEVLGAASDSVLFSLPVAEDERPPIAGGSHKERGVDSLAATRHLVQGGQPLTFDQLSWPTYEQMSGADGGSTMPAPNCSWPNCWL